MNDSVGRDIAVAGTYKTVESNPQRLFDVILDPLQVSTALTATLPMP